MSRTLLLMRQLLLALVSSSLILQSAPVHAADVNLALNKPVSVTSTENGGTLASYATDGSTTTRWASAYADPSSITVDLGAVTTINRVVLNWEVAYGKAYEIQVSVDGATWNTVYVQNAGTGGVESLSFNAAQARFVRMYGKTRGTGYGYSLWEFEVYGPAQNNGANLALGKPVLSSGDEGAGTTAAMSVDGNAGTRWSSNFVDNAWLRVDLGASKPVNRVVLNWEAAFGKAYQIQVSNDGNAWSTVYNQTAGKGGKEDLSFATANARYVRMQGQTRGTGYGYSLWEFEVYGNGVATAPSITTQPAAQTVVAGASAHFSVIADGSAPLAYQWQKNGVAISGATGSAYDTPATTAADNGASYRVVVSNAAGSITSAAAVLTVGAGLPYTVYPGFIGIDLKNNTNGAWRDDQIYIAVIGRNPTTGQFSWLKPDGTITQANAADNDGAGHLTKGGQNYANYFFTLAQAKLLKLPKMDSGRIFVSMGSPMYIKILSDINGNVGFAGPNPQNPQDPNIDVYYDWYEFSYNNVGIWINTTQVDQFGIPLLLDVWGSNASFYMQTGIKETRAAIYQKYQSELPAVFNTVPPSQYRIMAPAKSSFGVNQVNGHYFDNYVNDVWSYYSTNTLTVDMWGGARRFVGRTQGQQFVFTEVDKGNGAYVGGTYYIQGKPTTQDILEGAGYLAMGNSVESALGAQLCAAFNRHIMTDVTKWSTPSAWYLAAPANYYAKFWHDHSVGGIAYGFAYDDVSDQSSTIMATQPEHMVFGLGW
ncbi:beta-1,3-glucanase family protein [Niveibacterium sp. SC-1]|uniref:beta-1,3-glucanase family protein n=1 Tax=Niveibacterium sp. SC-1 TaxID=3135646 RepID=UPI00311DC500